jgi:hypothetical protein
MAFGKNASGEGDVGRSDGPSGERIYARINTRLND